MSCGILDCISLRAGAVVVPGRAPAFHLGDDLRGVVLLSNSNSAQVVIKMYDFVAEVEERTASVAVY